VTAIWLLSTKGRPEQCQEVLDACTDTGMTSAGIVYIDEDTGQYDNLRLPDNWTVHREPAWGSLQASMSWCYQQYPDASQFGWLADDTYPRTPAWDVQLEDAAGDWCLSYANDLWLSQQNTNAVVSGDDLTSGLCWGGELVRTVGWWALPGVRQAGIDTAWVSICSSLGLLRYRQHLVVEHKNWRTGKRDRDDIDDWSRNGDSYIERDIAIRNAWCASEDYRATLERVRRLARVEPSPEILERQRRNIRDAKVSLLWNPTSSAARLAAIIEQVNNELAEVFDEG
jgi:hypothetical protein